MLDLVARAEKIKERHVNKYASLPSTIFRVLEMYARVPAPVYVVAQTPDADTKKRRIV